MEVFFYLSSTLKKKHRKKRFFSIQLPIARPFLKKRSALIYTFYARTEKKQTNLKFIEPFLFQK